MPCLAACCLLESAESRSWRDLWQWGRLYALLRPQRRVEVGEAVQLLEGSAPAASQPPASRSVKVTAILDRESVILESPFP